jgi:hypothetical protein
MEKNQAAIEAGRYELEKRQFYHPNEYHQREPRTANHQPPYAEYRWNIAGGASETEQEKTSKSGSNRFDNFLNKVADRYAAGDKPAAPEPRPERARLRKRSSSLHRNSTLSAVGE